MTRCQTLKKDMCTYAMRHYMTLRRFLVLSQNRIIKRASSRGT